MILQRPLVYLDIEATGTDATRDRIVEMAFLKVKPDGTQEERVTRVNPGVRITVEVTAIHGITNEDVAKAPPFREIAPGTLEFLAGCDLAGFGISRFDVPLLVEEFKRCSLTFSIHDRAIIDGLTIFHQKEQRNLTAAYRFYCDKTLVGAHGARADALASMEVLLAQLKRYPDLPQDVSGLHEVCNKQDARFVDSHHKFIWKDGEAAFNFGKYKGETLRKVAKDQHDYLQWVVRDGKFAQEVVDICWTALRGEFPKKTPEVPAE